MSTDLPKGRIKKYEYMVKLRDGCWYDVYSLQRYRGRVNLGYGNGTWWCDIKEIVEWHKNE